MRWLFPTPPNVQQQPKIDDLEMGGSSYGQVLPYIFGTVRIPASLVFAGQVSMHQVESHSGGKGSSGGAATITWTISATIAYISCLGPVAAVRKAWGSGQLIYDASGDTLSGFALDKLTVYLGTEAQTPDPSIEAENPDTSAYRGSQLLVYEDVDLTEKFANRPPTLQVEVCGVATISGTKITPLSVGVGGIIAKLCDLAGVQDYDVSAVLQSVEGWVFDGDFRRGLGSLGDALGIRLRDEAGTLIFYETDDLVVAADLPYAELGVVDSEEEPRNLLPLKQADEVVLPRKLTVSYRDVDRDHQSGSQTVQRLAVTSTAEVVESYEEVALTATQARQLADRRLYRLWVESTEYGPFLLKPKYLWLRPGHVVTVTEDTGVQHVIRVTKVTIGGNFSVEVYGVAQENSIASSYLTGTSGNPISSTGGDPGLSVAYILDIPPLRDSHASLFGIYVAATGAAVAWRQAVVYQSVDSGASWAQIGAVSFYSVIGTCSSTLPAPAAGVGAGVFDLVSHVDVVVIKGELYSISDERIFAGENLCMVGDELLQYASANLIAANTYRLSKLLRGRKATESAMSGHVASESFVQLSNGATLIELPLSMIGQALAFRVVPVGKLVADENTVPHTSTGKTLRPWPPVDIRGARDGSANLTITFTRRSRKGTELPDSGDIPLDEPSALFEVDIMNGGNVVRTLSAVVGSVVYSAANQTTDFGSTQSSVVVNVYQVSTVVGRSQASNATV